MLIGTGVTLEHFVSCTVSWVRASIEFDKWLVEQLGLEPRSTTTPREAGRRRGLRPAPAGAAPGSAAGGPRARLAAAAGPGGRVGRARRAPAESLVQPAQPAVLRARRPLLAEGEADVGCALVRVVVEDGVGDGDDAAALGQGPAEGEAVVVAEGADVGGDEVGAGGAEDPEAGLGEARGQAGRAWRAGRRAAPSK